MELILLGITVISLIATGVLSVAVWRMNRAERTRSDARVAALNAAAVDDPVPAAQPAPQPQPVVEAAPAVEPVAVNDTRATPPWATARVSTFVTPKARGSDVVIRPALTGGEFPVEKSPMNDSFLGSGPAAPGDDRQKGLAIAAALLFVIVLAGGYWTVFGSRTTVARAATVAAPAPLELVSLRHERKGGRLAVSGLVRNPSSGSPVSKLTAVVFLFDQQGGFISSAKSDIDFVTLSPGDESPFVIAVDAPGTVARYRVSFRTDSGVVPHVDRRGQEPIAQGTLVREGA